ncbi:UrcA family protein [Sphingopyxis indica]|uniref:UrcA family protein n=1 Tax=Sphingopyxis indica TaxID=436663 RepID=A0A239J5X2_9SPHN|nr:UrcA family protein [Sphingopyxis indica]WOF42035.1 UrcA family protein [Sphingopyxis indica]SNT01169.1 UrcA family protein [Sphingopyxis indica]
MNRLICLTVLSLAATPAAAQPIIATAARGEGQTVLVHYSDLNLSSESGMARLDSRLRAAARQVCDVRLDKESLRTMTAESRCFDTALEQGRQAGREIMAARQSGQQLAAQTITVARP